MDKREDIELSLNLAHAIKRLIAETRTQQEEIDQLKMQISVLEHQLTSTQYTDETLKTLIDKVNTVHDGNRLIAKYVMKKRGDL